MWLSQIPQTQIYHNGAQVAEIIRDSTGYLIRNLRPNGTVGVCFSAAKLAEIAAWLDESYPGWQPGAPWKTLQR